MSNIATITSKTAGIDGPMTVIMQGSSNVVACGLAVSTIGDVCLPHKKYGSKRTHNVSVITGSSNVYVNGKQVAFVGSNTNCGDKVAISPATTVKVN